MGDFKRSTIKVAGVQEGEDKEIRPEKNNRKNGRNFPNLVKTKMYRLRESTFKKTIPTHIIVKVLTQKRNIWNR